MILYPVDPLAVIVDALDASAHNDSHGDFCWDHLSEMSSFEPWSGKAIIMAVRKVTL